MLILTPIKAIKLPLILSLLVLEAVYAQQVEEMASQKVMLDVNLTWVADECRQVTPDSA